VCVSGDVCSEENWYLSEEVYSLVLSIMQTSAFGCLTQTIRNSINDKKLQ